MIVIMWNPLVEKLSKLKGRRQELAAGDILFRAGDPVVSLFLVTAGALRLTIDVADEHAQFTPLAPPPADEPPLHGIVSLWLDAYDYTTDKGAVVLNDYASKNDPFARVGKESVTVQITSVTRASDSSFNVRWTEQRFANGAPTGTERWNAVVSIVLQTPRTEQRLRKNPLGIYVNGLSWSRELDASEGAKP